MSRVIPFTMAEYKNSRSRKKPVLLYFLTHSCAPCHLQEYILDEVAEMIGDRAIIGKINADDEPALSEKFEVQSIPIILLLVGGRLYQRMSGLHLAPTLVSALQKAGA